jgi:hypothetical protein
MSRALRAALQKLLDADGRLAASHLSSAQQRELDNFAHRTRSVSDKASGRGRVYVTLLPEVVTQRLQELSPLDAQDAHGLPQRAANIGQARASKSAAHGHDICYLPIKAHGQVGWKNAQGMMLDLTSATQQLGAACFAIGSPAAQSWHSNKPLWLIENQALFDHIDWLTNTQGASLIWYAGQLPGLLLDWLAAQARASQVWLFPDYDGVGLSNYARLKQRLGDQASLWLMPDWQTKLSRYGNNQIWQDTLPQFQSALQQLAPWLTKKSELHALVSQMQHQGLALEQEAIWLSV